MDIAGAGRPGNRQGRIAADAICGLPAEFHGTQGIAICGVFDLAVASTGASEKFLKRAGITDFQTLHLHAGDHTGYYPGAEKIHLKLVFRASDGRVLGAQAVGKSGVDKRIDVIAMPDAPRAVPGNSAPDRDILSCR